MATKSKRSGGKFGGGHTTLIPAALIVADIADKCELVTKISPGFIKSGLKPARGRKSVKITDMGSCLKLAVRDNTSHQQIHIYTEDTKKAQEKIAEKATKKGLTVSFGNA